MLCSIMQHYGVRVCICIHPDYSLTLAFITKAEKKIVSTLEKKNKKGKVYELLLKIMIQNDI